MGNAGPDGAISLAVVILQRRKVMVCTVLLDKGLFFKKRMMFAKKKRSVWPSSTLKTGNLEYCWSFWVAQVVRFWFKVYKIWLHMHNCSYKVTNQVLDVKNALRVSLFIFHVWSCSLVSCKHFMVSNSEPLITPHYVSCMRQFHK